MIQNSSRIDFPRNLDNVLPSLPRALELQSRSRFCHAFSSHEAMELKISKKRAESRKRRARSHATAANFCAPVSCQCRLNKLQSSSIRNCSHAAKRSL